MTKPRGVIFDLDGTLVDSRLDFAAMRLETGCPQGLGLLEHLDTLSDAADRQRAQQVIHNHEMDGARAACWMPGAKQLLEQLHRSTTPLGVVTRNSRCATELTLSSLDAPPMDLVTREDAAPKPSPDGLLQIAKRWNIAPAQLVYIGDYRFDLEAAAGAGMPSALYLQAGNEHFTAQAGRVFRHFSELHAWLLKT